MAEGDATSSAASSFRTFYRESQPRVLRALVARAGVDAAVDACADAYAHCWANWARVSEMANPSGYAYRVAASKLPRRRRAPLPPANIQVGIAEPLDPDLMEALRRLPSRQRTALVLVDGYGWSVDEVAELVGVRPSTVRTHQQRARKSVRLQMESRTQP